MSLKRREEIEASEGRDILRMAKRGGGSLLYTGVVVAALVVGLFVSMRLNYQFDVSRQGANRLSEQSVQVLKGLERDVTLYALYRKEPADRRETHWNILRLYREASPHITAEFYDPLTRPGVVRGLGLDPEQLGQNIDGLIVAVLGSHRLPLDPSVRKLTFRIGRLVEAEEAVSNAVIELSSEQERRVIGLLRGYGERDPDSDEGSGFSAAVRALEGQYYTIREVWLAEGVPEDVTVLVAAGPQLPIPPPEIESLRAWLEDGGRLYVMLDPGERTGLDAVLAAYGLRVDGRRIEDPQQNMGGDFTYLRATRYSANHEAVKGFAANLPTGFPEALPVVHEEVAGGQFHDGLVATSPFAYFWNPDGSRTGGPFALAAASWFNEELSDTRIILVGDSDFASNAYLPAVSNKNFFENCVAWLARRQDLMTIRRPPMAGQTIEIAPGEGRLLVAIVLATPMLLLVAGTLVFLRRRSL